MNKSFVRKSCVFTLALVSSVAAATTAFAGQAGWFTRQMPGIGCRTENANMHGIYSTLMNFDANPQSAWCPLESDYADMSPSDVTVVVDPGWATTQSCQVWDMTNPSSGWMFSPNSVTHDAAHNLDVVAFHMSTSYGVGAHVECSIPNWHRLMRYTERTYQYFDWASW